MSSNPQSKRANPPANTNTKPPGGKPKAGGGGGQQQRQSAGGAPPGGSKKATSPQQASRGGSGTTSATAETQADKMRFMLTALIGQTVVVTLKDGTQWEGLFHTANPLEAPPLQPGWGLVLRMAKQIATPTEPHRDTLLVRPVEVITIADSDLVMIVGKRISTDPQGPPRSAVMKFLTDTEISTKQGIEERELQSWLTEPGPGDANLLLGGLEDDTTGLGWDQFEVNRRKFNVKTTYREELYTTELDRDDPTFRQREAEAKRLAREIERETTSNVHLAEERGQKLQNDGLDEEDLYSSVIREAPQQQAGGRGGKGQQQRPVNYAAAAAAAVNQQQRIPPAATGAPPAGGASKYVVPARRAADGSPPTQPAANGATTASTTSTPGTTTPTEEVPTSPTLTSVDVATKRRSSRGMSGSFKVEPAIVQARQQQIVASSGTGASPSTSPILGRSASPNVKGLAPLQLDSSSPKLSERTARDFVDFDREYSPQESLRTREARTKELKKFSEELESKKIGSPSTLKSSGGADKGDKASGAASDASKPKLNPFAKEFKPGQSILAAITPTDGKRVQSTGPQLGPVMQSAPNAAMHAPPPYAAAPAAYVAAPPASTVPAAQQMGYYGAPVSVVPAGPGGYVGAGVGVGVALGPQPSVFLERPPFVDTRMNVSTLYASRMRSKMLRSRTQSAAAGGATPGSPSSSTSSTAQSAAASGITSGGSETWVEAGAGKRRQSFRDKEPQLQQQGATGAGATPPTSPNIAHAHQAPAPVMIGSPTLVAMSSPIGIPAGHHHQQPGGGQPAAAYYYQAAPYGYVDYGGGYGAPATAMSPPSQPGMMYAAAYAAGGYGSPQVYPSSPPQHPRGTPPKHGGGGGGGYGQGYPPQR